MAHARKELGQHWLTDSDYVRAGLELASITSDDTVLEIGPGRGALTKELLATNARVIAVELDESLVKYLNSNFAGRDLEVVRSSILDYDLSQLPSNYVVCANIPYNITAKIVRMLSDTENRPQRAILLVQQEVAEQLEAGPGSHTMLSLMASAYFEVYQGESVPPEAFDPPPKVTSAYVRLIRRDDADRTEVERAMQLAQPSFQQRRKKLTNTLAPRLGIDPEELRKWLLDRALSPDARPQELSIEDWIELGKLAPEAQGQDATS